MTLHTAHARLARLATLDMGDPQEEAAALYERAIGLQEVGDRDEACRLFAQADLLTLLNEDLS